MDPQFPTGGGGPMADGQRQPLDPFNIPTPPMTPEKPKVRPLTPNPSSRDPNLFPNVEAKVENVVQSVQQKLSDVPRVGNVVNRVSNSMPPLPSYIPQLINNTIQTIDYANAYCAGPGQGKPLCRLYNELRDNQILQDVISKVGTASSGIEFGETECFARFLKDVLNNGFSKEKWDKAVQRFKQEANLPDLPLEYLQQEIKDTLSGLSANLVMFNILPWLSILLIGVWLMVIAGWFGWVIGLFLTFGIIIIVYISLLILRQSMKSRIVNAFERMKQRFWMYIQSLKSSGGKLGGAVSSAACAYAGPKPIVPVVPSPVDAGPSGVSGASEQTASNTGQPINRPPPGPAIRRVFRR